VIHNANPNGLPLTVSNAPNSPTPFILKTGPTAGPLELRIASTQRPSRSDVSFLGAPLDSAEVHYSHADHPTSVSDHRNACGRPRDRHRRKTLATRTSVQVAATGGRRGAALEQVDDLARSKRQQAIEASSGKYADAFSSDFLAELRRDWPQ